MISKINRFKITFLSLLLLILFIVGFFCPGLTRASVDETFVDFGEVIVGETDTRILHITNLSERAGLSVSLELNNENIGFSIDKSALEIRPGSTEDVYVEFTPPKLGAASTILFVWAGSTCEEVELTGTGIAESKQNESEDVDDDGTSDFSINTILEFFDDAVGQGPIRGLGPGKSAPNRLNALRNMIIAAGDLIENEEIGEACGQLRTIYRKIDDLDSPKEPPDFAEGEAIEELRNLIEQAMEIIGCP